MVAREMFHLSGTQCGLRLSGLGSALPELFLELCYMRSSILSLLPQCFHAPMLLLVKGGRLGRNFDAKQAILVRCM